MRTLALIDKNPLPPDSGSRQRLFHMLHALDSLGPVDLMFDRPLDEGAAASLTHTFPGARIWAPLRPTPRFRIGRLRWLTARNLPLGLGLVDRRTVSIDSERFIAASPDPYDLVWSFSSTPSWLFADFTRRFPLVIDFADVRRVMLGRLLQSANTAPGRWRFDSVKARIRLRVERDRWARFDRNAAARANLVTVCSASDRESFGVPGAVVVSNGYARPQSRAGRDSVADSPCILFAGQMTYPPNVDGAEWFVHEVFPLVRAELPNVRLAIVGSPSPAVERLGDNEGVDVRGYVEVIEDELARADVAIVPLRHGSGTRIKIIEAWAHCIPVVSTTIGAEGLAVEDGRELMLADDAASFAAAITRVLREGSVRSALIEEGLRRFDADFDWAVIEKQFADRVATLVAGCTRFDQVKTT